MRIATLTLALAAGGLASCASDGDNRKAAATANPAQTAGVDTKPLSVEESATVALAAKVEAIDYTTRRVTLRHGSGRVSMFTAGPEIQRLNEVKAGDTVNAEYAVSILAELRPPTPEEAANPISGVGVSSSSPPGDAPSRGTGRSVKIVTTVQAIDVDKMLVTLKGPTGDTTTVRARKKENIQKLRVGDTIVITYVEATTISVVRPV
jgi:hypothetical protein